MSENEVMVGVVSPIHNVRSALIVDVAFGVCRDQLLAEERRQTLIVTKANALVGVAGLSSTVAFTFGAAVRSLNISALNVLYVLTLSAGAIAAICALKAMWVEGMQSINAKDTFNAEMLNLADKAEMPDDGTQPVFPRVGESAYKRYMTEHMALIYEHNSRRHEISASWVKTGQHAYVVFILLSAIAAITSISANPS